MNTPITPDLPQSSFYVYRSSCVAMLRRYFQMSIEIGRLPAILGREIFRSRSDTIRKAWFEDAVIYVHDIDRCLAGLHHFDQEVIARVIFQDYSQDQAARLLGCTDRHLRYRLAVSLDVLAKVFLERRLMVIASPKRPDPVVEDLPTPDEPEPSPSVADELGGPHDFAAAACAPSVAEDWGDPGSAWKRLPVEICCQAPPMSQIAASY